MKQTRPLILLIVGFAAIAYIGGILWAGIASVTSPTMPKIPELVTRRSQPLALYLLQISEHYLEFLNLQVMTKVLIRHI